MGYDVVWLGRAWPAATAWRRQQSSVRLSFSLRQAVGHRRLACLCSFAHSFEAPPAVLVSEKRYRQDYVVKVKQPALATTTDPLAPSLFSVAPGAPTGGVSSACRWPCGRRADSRDLRRRHPLQSSGESRQSLHTFGLKPIFYYSRSSISFEKDARLP